MHYRKYLPSGTCCRCWHALWVVLVAGANLQATAADDWQPYGDRYAIIVMSDGWNADQYFWPATNSMHEHLLEMGFARENVRFLAPARYATKFPQVVCDEATKSNIDETYQWATSVCTDDDLLYIYWISHGTSTYFTTAGRPVKHSTLAAWTKEISARQIIGVYQPCLSGAVLDDLSRKDCITITSTDPTTDNGWPWGENIANALAGPTHCKQFTKPAIFFGGHRLVPAEHDADEDGDGQISVTEAYTWVAKHHYTEGSMLDDNGDGVGGQWKKATFDPMDPSKDGFNGMHYSLTGWKPINANPAGTENNTVR